MITQFPDFKPLELFDKKYIETFTVQFPPYSDFNFTSIWAWNTNDKFQISNLNGNLVVLFYDYLLAQIKLKIPQPVFLNIQ